MRDFFALLLSNVQVGTTNAAFFLAMSGMCVKKATRTRRIISSFLESGVVAMPQGEITALQNSLRDFSYIGIDHFETYLASDIFMVLRLFNKAARKNSAEIWDWQRVSSISEALQVLGVEQIYEILEAASNKRIEQNPRQQKIVSEASHEAFITGVLTKTLASKFGFGDDNRLMLAGQMQQIGRVVACAAFPFEFERINSNSKNLKSNVVEKKYFGSSYLDISNQLLQESYLPKDVLTILSKANQQESSDGPCDEESSLLSAARLTTNLISSPNLSWAEFESSLTHLLPKISKNIKVSRKDFIDSLGEACECLDQSHSINHPIEESSSSSSRKYPIAQRLNILASESRILFPPLQRSREIPMNRISFGEHVSSPKFFGNEEERKLAGDVLISNTENISRKRKGNATGLAAALQVFSIIKTFQSMSKDSIAEFIAWSHVKALNLKNCLIMVPNEQEDELSLMHAEGPWFVEGMSEIVVDRDSRTVFSASLQTQKDVILKLPTPAKIRKYIPKWLKPMMSQHHCAILPAFSDDKLQAVLICLGADSDIFAGDRKILGQSLMLRNQFAEILSSKNGSNLLLS